MHIASFNCRGLGKSITRRHIFNYLSKFSISCLQESYVTNENAAVWSKEFEGEFFFESGTEHSKGLIILVNRKLQINDLHAIKINERCLGISFTSNSKLFYIFNVYAPAKKDERIPFLNNLGNLLKIHDLPIEANIIICGDFNSVLNNQLDILTGLPHSLRETQSFNNFIKNFQLTDCFRKLNPTINDYSWIRFNKNSSKSNDYVARRLDYILCNKNASKCLKASNMSHVASSDHKLISSVFLFDNFPKGPGRWHFNESLLEDEAFLSHMESFITNFLSKPFPEFDYRLTWDLLKVNIRDECISFSRHKNINSPLKKLNADIIQLNNQLLLNPHDNDIVFKLSNKITQKELFELSEAKGALKRSRLQHISENERNTKYFLSFEKYRQNSSTITSIYDNTGALQESPPSITACLTNFYKNLLNDPHPPLEHPPLDLGERAF